MPTPTGLPKVGEIWERTTKLPPDWRPQTIRFLVLERGRGELWSMKVYIPKRGTMLWPEASYFMHVQELSYIGDANPQVRKHFNIGG